MKTKKKLKFLREIAELALDHGLDVRVEAEDSRYTSADCLGIKATSQTEAKGLVLLVMQKEESDA